MNGKYGKKYKILAAMNIDENVLKNGFSFIVNKPELNSLNQ